MKRKKTSDFTSLGFVFDLVSWTKRWNKGDDVIRCSCDNWLLYPQTMYSFLTIELLEMLCLSLLFDPYSASYIYGDQNSTMYLSVGSTVCPHDYHWTLTWASNSKCFYSKRSHWKLQRKVPWNSALASLLLQTCSLSSNPKLFLSSLLGQFVF